MASDIRSRYPYLSDKDWNRYRKDPDQLENLNDIRKIDLVEKLANFSLSENTFNVKIPSHSTVRDDLRLVIIGKTGQGKSATANTILGKEKFKEDFTASSVTKESRCVTEVVDGRKISVMDTPGSQDTHQSKASILKELARMTKLFPDGVHAFVYVMNIANPRFTAEDKNILDLIEETFGGGFRNYCLLVFSHGDSTLKDVDLDTYRKRQMEIAQVTRGHPTQQNVRKDQRGQDQDKTDFANLLDELSWRMLAIDNKTSVPFAKSHYRKQIVAMVDRMRTLNSPEIYTNGMFVTAQQQREAMRQEDLRKGWDPSIMRKVETIIAANPDISTEELNAEVNRHLKEENRINKLKRREKELIIRRRRQANEDRERKNRNREEERIKQENRDREEKQWQSRQEQLELEMQRRLELEMQRRLEHERQRREQFQQQADQGNQIIAGLVIVTAIVLILLF